MQERPILNKQLNSAAFRSFYWLKEELVESDEEMILQYMRTHNNEMPYTSKSSAEVIEEVFHMSRKAFKRALGDLYKKREIYFDEENTYITKN